MHHLLREALPGAHYYNGSPEQYDSVTAEELKKYSLLLGHFSYSQAKKFNPQTYLITFLRDPIDRVISSYYFLRSWNGVVDDTNRTMVAAAKDLSFRDFLKSRDPQVRSVIFNHQTYFLGADWRDPRDKVPENLINQALENLQKLSFVGLTERYPESVKLLFRDLRMEQTPAVKALNTTPFRPAVQEIAEEDRILIQEQNQMDMIVYAEAQKLFEVQQLRILSSAPEIKTDNPEGLKKIGIELLHGSAGRVSQIVKSEQIFKELVSLAPDDAEAWFWLGESLCYQGRTYETEAIFAKAISAKSQPDTLISAQIHERYAQALQFNDKLKEAAVHYRKAIELNPALAEDKYNLGGAVYNLDGLNKLDHKQTHYIARWPNKLSDFSDLRAAVFKYIVKPAAAVPVIDQASRVLTFGSCFAQNLALALEQMGVNAQCLGMGELINSTYANRALMNWLLDSKDEPVPPNIAGVFEHCYGKDKENVRRYFSNADVVVFTLGVAPCFFDKKTGDFYLSYPNTNTLHLLAQNEFKTTTVEENAANLDYLIQAVRKIAPRSKLFFTVSPVPLAATFEYPSAIVADCVSKSTLRVAIDQICRTNVKDVFYWPSFEIVKWLGVYGSGAYGAEDGTSRHISEAVIKVITEAFLAVYGDQKLERKLLAARA